MQRRQQDWNFGGPRPWAAAVGVFALVLCLLGGVGGCMSDNKQADERSAMDRGNMSHTDASRDHPVAARSASSSMGPSETRSLYDRLGGEKAISAVVDEFVARASTDPKVNFNREGTPAEWVPSPANVATLKRHLTQFIANAAGGPQNYEGRDMVSAHTNMHITDAEFDAIAADLAAALDKFSVPAREKGELLSVVASTRAQIVGK